MQQVDLPVPKRSRIVTMYGQIQKGDKGSRPPPPPMKNHKNRGFLSNTGPESPEKSQTFIVGQPSACQRIFRWQADDGPLIVVFVQILSPPKNKTLSKLDPYDKTFWIRICHATG